jgi:anti-anti-sigma factor
MLNFDMTTKEFQGGVLLCLRGDLDVQTVDDAREEMLRIEATEPAMLVVDLSGLSFLDSTGMGLVAAAHLHAADAGRRFVVVRPRNPVNRAFLLAGYTDVWETVASVDEVLEGT